MTYTNITCIICVQGKSKALKGKSKMKKTTRDNMELLEKVETKYDGTLASALCWLDIELLDKNGYVIISIDGGDILASGKVKTVRDTLGYCLTQKIQVTHLSYSFDKKNHYYITVSMGL